MDKRIDELMEKIKSSIPRKSYLALMDEDGKIHYNNFHSGLNGLIRNFAPAIKTLDVGDYQIKNYAKTCLIIYKVSERLALLAESYVKEGLLIFTIKNIAENLKDQFIELDILLMFLDMAKEEKEAKITEQLV
ncbi:MAG: hypothetical protein ACUVXA_07450 [Candidatus Jordarchaeum sp.]|uniref:hypothetical protein n=1 Tax=Candidatus Jordarchaeum sp. TaxID=2823881 RepID=UPI00404B937F